MATFSSHPELPEALELLLASDVQTVFLKAACPPRVKRGDITSLRLEEIESDDEWDNIRLESIQEVLLDLVNQNNDRPDCFLEIDRKGCQVIQLGDLRVTMAWPPFSDSREITIVRPVAKLRLSEYELDQRLVDRLSNHHRGVFICGRPGSGKTTLAQAIAEHLDEEIGAMVKTMEAPRDLQLPDRVTQYAPLEGDLEKTAEVIFLVRPDFVIFDEVRRARDFEIFADVRLAGVGLLGVTHANSALEAIQRLIGKVELGLVSQVLDTILHVEKGQVTQVLELRMTVKAPHGMQEELSRPVIEVVEFPAGKVTHEMFAFGSEISVVPVEGGSNATPVQNLAKDAIIHKIREWIGVRCEVQFIGPNSAKVFAPEDMISTLVGKGGNNVKQLQEELGGIRLEIASFSELPKGMKPPPRDHFEEAERRSYESRAWEKHRGKGKRRRRNR